MKSLIRNLFRAVGLDLRRLSAATDSNTQILAALRHVQCNLLLDIGANTGQYAQSLRTAGYAGKIISFEPLANAHQKLVKAASCDPNWIVHPREAVGDQNGTIEFNIARNSVSSSALPMLETHVSAARDSTYIATERVNVARLDTIADQYTTPNSRLFVKIDTQGFEWQVLDGAKNTVDIAIGIQIELSLIPLYEGQHLWLDIIKRMESSGFTLWAVIKGFTDQRTGRSLQLDAIFLRL